MEMTKMIKELQEKLGEEYEIELACNEKNNLILLSGYRTDQRRNDWYHR